MITKKHGRPRGIKPRSDDLDILWQVYIWMTWPQYRTRSFDQLARWAAMIRPARGRPDNASQPTEAPPCGCGRGAGPVWIPKLGIATADQGTPRSATKAKWCAGCVHPARRSRSPGGGRADWPGIKIPDAPLRGLIARSPSILTKPAKRRPENGDRNMMNPRDLYLAIAEFLLALIRLIVTLLLLH